MEWVVFGLLVWFFYNRSKKKKWKRFEKEASKQAGQQLKYERFMNNLPALRGDGSFSQEIKGEQAYKDNIDLFGEYLERYHPGEDFMVMVELEPSNKHDPNAVRVDAGQATIGYIPKEDAEEFGKELAALGGRASCSASLYWSPVDGRSSITLDVVRPLELE